MNIEEIKNTLREFQAQNGRKFKNTQAEFKKVVSYKKKKCNSIGSRVMSSSFVSFEKNHTVAQFV